MVNEAVRYQDPSVPLDASAAERADNYSAQTALYATHKRILALKEEMVEVQAELAGSPLSAVEGKSGKTIIITKTSGGVYASLQAAVDAANSGDVVVVGSGNWGEVVLKAGVSLMGLQPPLADEVVLSKITFAPGSGSAATNTVYVSNLRISRGDDQTAAVLGGDGGKVRVHLDGVRFYRNNAAAANPLVSCGGNDDSSSIYMHNCSVTHEGGQVGNSIILLLSSVRYLDLNNCMFSQGGHCLAITAGTVAASLCRFETASSLAAIHISGAGSSLAVGNSLIRNTGTNSSGVRLESNTVCAAANVTFDVSLGTGEAVEGASGAFPGVGSLFYKNNCTVAPGKNSTVSGPNVAALQVL